MSWERRFEVGQGLQSIRARIPAKAGAGSPAQVEASPFPQLCSPPARPSPGSGDQALFTLEVGFPGAGAGEVGASLSSGSELEHSNYAGGFMSLCL